MMIATEKRAFGLVDEEEVKEEKVQNNKKIRLSTKELNLFEPLVEVARNGPNLINEDHNMEL